MYIFIFKINKSPWDGGVYILMMDFSQGYPIKPPKCKTYIINKKG